MWKTVFIHRQNLLQKICDTSRFLKLYWNVEYNEKGVYFYITYTGNVSNELPRVFESVEELEEYAYEFLKNEYSESPENEFWSATTPESFEKDMIDYCKYTHSTYADVCEDHFTENFESKIESLGNYMLDTIILALNDDPNDAGLHYYIDTIRQYSFLEWKDMSIADLSRYISKITSYSELRAYREILSNNRSKETEVVHNSRILKAREIMRILRDLEEKV